MPQISGTVRTIDEHREAGAPVAGAQIAFRPLNGGSPGTATSGAGGGYQAQLERGSYLAVTTHADFDTEAPERGEINIERPNHTFNVFLPTPRASLLELAAAFPGEIGIYARNLNSGAEVHINSATPFYLASVSKVAIAVAAVARMNSLSDASVMHRMELQDYRQEAKPFRYDMVDTTPTLEALLKAMIRSSDTTATDMIVRLVGHDRINESIRSLGLPEIGEITSMIELDRIRWAMTDELAVEAPAWAFSLRRRTPRTHLWLKQLGFDREISGPSGDEFEEYLKTGLNHATPRAMGELMSRMAQKTIFADAWRNDFLLDTFIAAAGEGRFSRSVPPAWKVDTKGGSHRGVRAALGIVKDPAGAPRAILGVFAQRLETSGGDTDPYIARAGNLAYRAIGFTPSLPAPSISGSTGIRFVDPVVGDVYEHGERPVVRWISKGLSADPLKLELVGPNRFRRTLGTNVRDDGEWHSLELADDLAPGSTYRLILSGTDTNDDPVTGKSSHFAIGGVIRVLEPHAGKLVRPGTTVPIRWTTAGLEGKLRIELWKGDRREKVITTNARDDGEWHSFDAPRDVEWDTDYRIFIQSLREPSIQDSSPEFTIGGKIEFEAPALGEVIDIGDAPTIRWSTVNVPGNLRLELMRGEDRRVLTISDDARNDGEWHSFTVPESIHDGDGYRIRAIAKQAPAIRGASHYFQIGTRYEWLTPSAEQAPFGTDAAARPHYFPFGSTPTLKWRTIGDDSSALRIQLVHEGRTVERIASRARDDGEWHSWTPTDELEPSAKYRLLLINRDRSNVRAWSPFFSLGAMIQVHLAKRTFAEGDKPKIEWRTDGVSGKLTLEVTDREDERVLRISGGAIDDGSWTTWAVPESLDDGWYRFKLTSNELPDVFGHSEWFRIDND